MGSLELMVKSMLDLRQLETFGHKKSFNSPPHNRDRRSMSNLQAPVLDEKARRHRAWLHSDWLSHSSRRNQGVEEVMVFPEENEDGDYTMKEQNSRGQWEVLCSESQDSRSPDSACSLGYDSRESSPDYFLDDFADVDSLNQDSSDDEDAEEKKEKVQKVKVTSVDEALRAVTEDHSPGDFLKQNYEALADSSNTSEQSPVPRLSMSSRFLARGHNIRRVPIFTKVHGKEQDSHSAKPPMSKVRPLMEDVQGRSIEDKTSLSTCSTKGSKVDIDSTPILRPQKRKTSGPHLWRLSIPPTKALSLLDRAEGLQKAHSVQNLSSETPLSPVVSSDQRQILKRPQHLVLNHSRPSFHFSSPSTGSPLSPQSPLPWDGTPTQKSQHSYMNPTASSIAKISRSSSVGEGLQVGTPPRSPCSLRGKPDSDAAVLASSPVTPSPSSISKTPSPPLSHRTSLTPSAVPPSRIPLPKQPLSPRRCLVLEVKPSPSRSSTPTTDPASDAAPTNKQVLSRHLSLEPPAQSLLPVKQKRSSVSESTKESEQVAAAKERPLVIEQAGMSSAETQQDQSITLETCRQAVSELQDCLKRTIMFYTTVVGSGPELNEDQQQMKTVLSEALLSIKTELHSLPQHDPQVVRGEGDKTMALLKQYAELLLKSVEKKLDTKT